MRNSLRLEYKKKIELLEKYNKFYYQNQSPLVSDKKYDELKFARSIAKLSKVNVVIVNDKKQILRYLSRNIYSDEIIIGMGAGTISNWIRKLPDLMWWK